MKLYLTTQDGFDANIVIILLTPRIKEIPHYRIHKRNLIPIILESYNQIERYTLLRRVLKKEKEILEVVLNQR